MKKFEIINGKWIKSIGYPLYNLSGNGFDAIKISAVVKITSVYQKPDERGYPPKPVYSISLHIEGHTGMLFSYEKSKKKRMKRI